MSTDPTVFVVDDDPAMRQSLRWLLQSVGLSVDTFATAEEFLTSYRPEARGCLLLDVRMPGLGGLGLQDELNRREVHLPVIIITAFAEVPMAVRALKGGASDFLEKPFSDEVLIERVKDAITADQTNHEANLQRAAAADLISRLSVRQRQVMDHVVQGKQNKLIADILGIREKTVEVHRAQLMRRLNVDTLAALVRLVTLVDHGQGKPVDRYRKFPS